MEPTEEQYLILNALETLAILIDYRYDEETGLFFIRTISPILPLSILGRDGDILSIEP